MRSPAAGGRMTIPSALKRPVSLGIKVSDKMPEDVYRLMNLYPQARARRPSVEYIPLPYERRPRAATREAEKK